MLIALVNLIGIFTCESNLLVSIYHFLPCANVVITILSFENIFFGELVIFNVFKALHIAMRQSEGLSECILLGSRTLPVELKFKMYFWQAPK